MSTAEWVDSVVKILGLLGAGLAFGWGVREWREGQRWKRAERRDTLIAEFENTPLIRLGAKVVDWGAATVQLGERKVVYGPKDVQGALRIHWGIDRIEYPSPQDALRDGIDALLTFFVKLEHEISKRLVEKEATIGYFVYWLWRLNQMSEYKAKGAGDFAAAMRAYERAYSDADALSRLFAAAESTLLYKRLASHASVPPSSKP